MTSPVAVSILERLDSEKLKVDLNVKDRSLRLVRERGVFPASWYPVIKRHCKAKKIGCPDEAFHFKPQSEQTGSAQ